VLANNGAALVGNHGGGLVSDNGGGLVSNNGGGLTGQTKYTGRRLAATLEQVPLAGAIVTLVDASGAAVKGPDGQPVQTTTDATGGYAFRVSLPKNTWSRASC
jgi:hypothetical protein